MKTFCSRGRLLWCIMATSRPRAEAKASCSSMLRSNKRKRVHPEHRLLDVAQRAKKMIDRLAARYNNQVAFGWWVFSGPSR